MPIGSNFDEFLKEEGIAGACTEGAIKKVQAVQNEASGKIGGHGQSETVKSMPVYPASPDQLPDAE